MCRAGLLGESAPDCYIFSTSSDGGRPWWPSSATRSLRLLQERLGLPPVALQELRRFHSSLIAAAGGQHPLPLIAGSWTLRRPPARSRRAKSWMPSTPMVGGSPEPAARALRISVGGEGVDESGGIDDRAVAGDAPVWPEGEEVGLQGVDGLSRCLHREMRPQDGDDLVAVLTDG